jgi:endonuclease/exonuclease/phosphatase family metal-dependent hydrolase
MRIIAWNANCVRHKKRSFEENAKFLFAEDADVIILSETTRPTKKPNDHVDWVEAGNLGLGVEARNGYTIMPYNSEIRAPLLFSAYRVGGPVSFNLLAAWPVKLKGGPSYSQLLNNALDVYREFLSESHSIMAGDLNSTARIPAQTKLHRAFVEKAGGFGLKSIYHVQNGVPHGKEKDDTYRHGGRGKGRFHIDYCFLSAALLGSATIRVLNSAVWEARSDHYPIQIDLSNDKI